MGTLSHLRQRSRRRCAGEVHVLIPPLIHKPKLWELFLRCLLSGRSPHLRPAAAVVSLPRLAASAAANTSLCSAAGDLHRLQCISWPGRREEPAALVEGHPTPRRAAHEPQLQLASSRPAFRLAV